jgi:hypothetical protein
MRLFSSLLLYGLLFGAVMGCSHPMHQIASDTISIGPSCARGDNVGYWNLPATLNRVTGSWCSGEVYCRGMWKNYQVKTIAAYGDIQQWLWSGSSSATFSIVDQNAIIANARSIGTANKPSGKTLVQITYFSDFLVGPNGYFIGAHVAYASCGGLPS